MSALARFVSHLNDRLDRHETPKGGKRFFALRRWSVENWLKGYRFGAVQRCRWCDHTTPYHYPTCRQAPNAYSDTP